MILVKFDKDWADEFNADGFKLFKDRAAFEAEFVLYKEQGFQFGTNEGWEEGEIDSSDFTITDIGDIEAAVIERFFGKEYGIFPYAG